jgi:hypothetical protein
MDCANIADTQSKEVRGPGGVAAVLTVHSEDDHGKNTHACNAEYGLVLTPSDEAEAKRFYSSDADWGRRLSVHLDGFSQDGKHVFGVISEGGEYSSVVVFDYDMARRHAELIKIEAGLTRLRAAKCGTSFAVSGIGGAGSIVLEPNTASPCKSEHRWLLDSKGHLEALSPDKPYLKLYAPPGR